MLTLIEKILFALAVFASIYAAWKAYDRLVKIISRGHGKPDWKVAQKRLVEVLVKTVALTPTWRIRLGPSILHAMVAWGFMYFLLVNMGDVYQGYFGGKFLGDNVIGNLYRLGADILSVSVLVGMAALLIRRGVFKAPELTTRDTTLLHPKARMGIKRDSLIVGTFILFHIGFRFLGTSFEIAQEGHFDAWQPFASMVSGLWAGWSEGALTGAVHVSFWMALGLILVFVPYFPYSKHIHLFFAPLNFLLKPERRSPGQLSYINFEDDKIEQFGATKLEHLGYEQLMDAYACIMCNRCQQVCPAYNTGKVLSPAALEINKRYFINQEGTRIANGEESSQTLLEFAITPEAVWACTACGACTDICPVGNEPMRDILEIRRSLVLMDNEFPTQLQNAYKGMERNVNPWNVSPAERMKWSDGLEVPTFEENPEAEILWWVGCAAATDSRAQKTARAFAEILNKAGVNFAVLGEGEQCTGDSARRSGAEHIFFELATANVEILNEVTSNGGPKRIVANCPHCLHTLMNEYPAFGGNYEVLHHTQLINELVGAGKLKLDAQKMMEKVTFHDPCYLGRQNGIVDAPRITLEKIGMTQVEMPRRGAQSFCCGAGGGQIWKEEEHGTAAVNETRFKEAQATGAGTLAVGCPFCMTMMTDAAKGANSEMQVKDVAELVLEAMK
ncbi:MAG: (Fe-S)-binding protein [Anaerolineales bacterium]|nr:(Fe-S)-binding protein [Anaerolineales bacterium]